MALTIVVRSAEGKRARRITFDSPRVVVGRGDGCEVRLPDPSVSHRHASIRQRGADYIVMDEGSTNGTFVGPVRLSAGAPRVLRSGDLVRVGRVWLEAIIEQALPTQNGPLATREMALALISDALAAEGSAAQVKVTVLEGPGTGAELAVEAFDQAYVVGRGKGADLDVDDPDLSRRHVEIFRRGSGVAVRDLGSKNGSFLGDQKLTDSAETPWPEGESLRIGKSRLVYEDPAGTALEELEKAADERMPAGESLPPPSPSESSARLAEQEALAQAAKRDAPLTPKPPRRSSDDDSVGWTASDVLVAFAALVVLVLSVAALIWLIRSG